MPRLLTNCHALLFFALLTVGLCGKADAQNAVPVAVSEVRQQQIFRQVSITGTVTSENVARLSPSIAGLVNRLHVMEGDPVQAGELLLELDAELAELQWQSAKALQQQAQTALEDAQRRLSEAQQLEAQRSISKTAVRSLEAEVAENRAVLDRAQADARYRQAVLARHQLKAPFAGVINKKLTEQGEWVNQGQGVLELVAIERLRLDFAVPEDYLVALQPDAPVRFTLNALPGKSHAGRVQTIVPVTDPGARTFLLRILPTEDSVTMLPGMSVRAVLKIPESDADSATLGLAVPRDALLRYPDGRTVVWTVEQDGQNLLARENLVQTGKAFDGLVEIRSGLTEGARIIVRGNEALRDGQSVRIVDERR